MSNNDCVNSNSCVRINVKIPREVHKKLRLKCIEENSTIQEMVAVIIEKSVRKNGGG